MSPRPACGGSAAAGALQLDPRPREPPDDRPIDEARPYVVRGRCASLRPHQGRRRTGDPGCRGARARRGDPQSDGIVGPFDFKPSHIGRADRLAGSPAVAGPGRRRLRLGGRARRRQRRARRWRSGSRRRALPGAGPLGLDPGFRPRGAARHRSATAAARCSALGCPARGAVRHLLRAPDRPAAALHRRVAAGHQPEQPRRRTQGRLRARPPGPAVRRDRRRHVGWFRETAFSPRR